MEMKFLRKMRRVLKGYVQNSVYPGHETGAEMAQHGMANVRHSWKSLILYITTLAMQQQDIGM